MNPDLILVRLGELTLKGRNRFRFETRIVQQVHAILQSYEMTTLSREFGRLYIELNGVNGDDVIKQLLKVPGIASISPVQRTRLDRVEISEIALHIMQGLPTLPRSFRITVKRVNKTFPWESTEFGGWVGGYVLQRMPGLTVDLHTPEAEVGIEIREKFALLYGRVVEGMGGYPLGSSGKAILMLSGGIDSPVAGWLAMRRGLRIEAVHFHSYPYTSERAKQKVIDLTRVLSHYAGSIRIHLVPFTAIQVALKEQGQDNLMITLMRRAMFRITEQIAMQQGALGIITGESLGQVASQTLPSMYAVQSVISLPVLQPLITMDKKEIIEISRKIETYDISIRPYEDCCTLFMPRSPSTNPNQKVLTRIENRIQKLDELVAAAVAETEAMMITPQELDGMDHLF